MTAKKAVQTPRFFRFLHYYIGFFNFQHNSSGFIFCYTFKPKRTFSIFRLSFVKQCGRTWKKHSKKILCPKESVQFCFILCNCTQHCQSPQKIFFRKKHKKTSDAKAAEKNTFSLAFASKPRILQTIICFYRQNNAQAHISSRVHRSNK